ncbi:MAG: DNA polymerase III subunit [Dehalococcoidales bacterium]|nr:DNA polymerase III subunit [Dehalococcoidales bacterium]
MWQVIGHRRVVGLLQHSLEIGAVAPAYLLVGPPHVGKMTLALDLAKALNCEAANPPCGECTSCRKIASAKYADVQIIDLGVAGDSAQTKPRAEISIDQIRQLQHSANLPPFEGRCKVFIINGAERLSSEAANCLLKTLEEPAEKVVFILLATNDRLLPATVVSRCQRLGLSPLPVDQLGVVLNQRYGIELGRAGLLARLSHGYPGGAISAAQDDSWLQRRGEKLERLLGVMDSDYDSRFDYVVQLVSQFSRARELVYEVLDLWLDYWRDLLLVKVGCTEAITNADRLAGLVDRAKGYRRSQIRDFIRGIRLVREQLGQNANPQLALEVLMLNIPVREMNSG